VGELLGLPAFQNHTAIRLKLFAFPVPTTTASLKAGVTLEKPAPPWQGHQLLIEGQSQTLAADPQATHRGLKGQRRTDLIGPEVNGHLLPVEPGLALGHCQTDRSLQHQPTFERVARQGPGLKCAGGPLARGIRRDHRTTGFEPATAW